MQRDVNSFTWLLPSIWIPKYHSLSPETAKSTKLIDPNIEKGTAKQAASIPQPCMLLGKSAEGTLVNLCSCISREMLVYESDAWTCLTTLASHWRESSHIKDNPVSWVKVKGRMVCQKQMRIGEMKRIPDLSLMLLKNSKKGSEWIGIAWEFYICFFHLKRNQYNSKITRVSLQSSKSNLFPFILQHL